jgi:Cytochrome c554 and c-prime
MSHEQRNVGSCLKAALFTLLILFATIACVLHPSTEGTAAEKPPLVAPAVQPAGQERDPFKDWPRPDFVLVLSGQMHGYLQPCGCSRPQAGGLERRYNFVQSLRKDRRWPVVALDLGDIPQVTAPGKLPNVQGILKYTFTMRALESIGYSAVTFGEYEAAQPLTSAIDNYAANADKPSILATNFLNKAALFDYSDHDRDRNTEWGGSYVGSWQISEPMRGVKVGVIASIGPGVEARIQNPKEVPPRFRFSGGNQAIPAAIKKINAAGANFRVLLYQGSVAEAKLCAAAMPELNVILCLAAPDETPERPEVVGDTFILRVGDKGKCVGVVGVTSPGSGRPFRMNYRLVQMGEEYATPPSKEKDHPILALLEEYTGRLRDDDYLAQYGKVGHETQAAIRDNSDLAGMKSGYVGSEACKNCHEHAYTVWKGSRHANAYKALEQARMPSLRDFDAECVVCHTVGFRFKGGFTSAAATPGLKGVGCESCHGPCEAHIAERENKDVRALINRWKTLGDKEHRESGIERTCRECHDDENDVKWDFAKWAKVEHMTLKGPANGRGR